MIDFDPHIKRLIKEQCKIVREQRLKEQEKVITELLYLTPLNIDKNKLNDEKYCRNLIQDLNKTEYTIFQEIDVNTDSYSAVLYRKDKEIARRTINLKINLK